VTEYAEAANKEFVEILPLLKDRNPTLGVLKILPKCSHVAKLYRALEACLPLVTSNYYQDQSQLIFDRRLPDHAVEMFGPILVLRRATESNHENLRQALGAFRINTGLAMKDFTELARSGTKTKKFQATARRISKKFDLPLLKKLCQEFRDIHHACVEVPPVQVLLNME
jgi:hypothetical protein